MKNFFQYELKRNFLLGILITIVLTYISIQSASTGNIEFRETPWIAFMVTNIPIMGGLFFGLSLILPMVMFSFGMDFRSLDLLYSLPIKRSELYGVKFLVGLFYSIIPFTIAYWLGVIVLAIRGAEYNFIFYLPAYFLIILLGSVLYSIASFLYSRAYRIGDGIIFVFANLFGATFLLSSLFGIYAPQLNWDSQAGYLNPAGPLFYVLIIFNNWVLGRRGAQIFTDTWITFGLMIVVAVLSVVFLLLTAKKQKIEKAGNDSDSLFGYKVLIPVFFVPAIALVVFGMADFSFSALTLFFILLGIYISYATFRRKLRIKKIDWIIFAGIVVLGIILGLIGIWVYNAQPVLVPPLPAVCLWH